MILVTKLSNFHHSIHCEDECFKHICEKSVFETLVINCISGEITSLQNTEYNNDIKIEVIHTDVQKYTKSKFCWQKFKFIDLEYYSEIIDFELTYSDTKYIPVNIIGHASQKYGIQFVQNIWNIFYKNLDKVVAGESIIDFLVSKFTKENSISINTISICNNIISREG